MHYFALGLPVQKETIFVNSENNVLFKYASFLKYILKFTTRFDKIYFKKKQHTSSHLSNNSPLSSRSGTCGCQLNSYALDIFNLISNKRSKYHEYLSLFYLKQILNIGVLCLFVFIVMFEICVGFIQ